MPDVYHVYYLSDSTGITVEAIGRSALAQFSGVQFEEKTLAFVSSEALLLAAAAEIARSAAADKSKRPIVFYTFADEKYAAVVEKTGALMLDCLDVFIRPLTTELKREPSHAVGGRMGDAREQDYQRRIDALNYTMHHDDGATLRQYEQADIILLGVSRSGKTPTSMYLALHYGVFAANYPLVDEDLASMNGGALPPKLAPHKSKLYGLTIDPKRLTQIRGERRPNSRYAELENCRHEVAAALRLFEANGIRYLDVTKRSVEELASKILSEAHLPRYL